MTDSPILPGDRAWRDANGKQLPVEFYKFFRDLTAYVRRTQGASATLADIIRRLTELESEIGGSQQIGNVVGRNSVVQYGRLSDGAVFLELVNDQQSPDPLRYYGTNADGERGYHELPTGGVPYFIPEGSTFRVREYLQALFSMPIDVEGFLEVDGFLVEVD